MIAFKDPNWKMEMHDEYNALIKNETWDLVPLVLMLFDLCGFLDKKKNALMGHLRGIKLDL